MFIEITKLITTEELPRQLSSTGKIHRWDKGPVKPSVLLGCLQPLKAFTFTPAGTHCWFRTVFLCKRLFKNKIKLQCSCILHTTLCPGAACDADSQRTN